MIRSKFGLALVALAASTAALASPPPTIPPPPPMLAGDQYLYGSAEASALTREVWHMLVDYVAEAAKAKGNDRKSVVLTIDATLNKPSFVPCGDKPPAVVVDVDETSILNLGMEYDTLKTDRYLWDDDVWPKWEQTGYDEVVPTPGAKAAFDHLRAMGVTVIFNTNRNAFNAKYTEKALDDAGLGPAVHGKTLFLAGDDNQGSFKDGRRQIIASRYCVLAMAGDQLVDISDRFTTDYNFMSERRALAALPAVAEMWGNGWFVMPNPVYGSGLQGSIDDIFPADKRWSYEGADASGSKK